MSTTPTLERLAEVSPWTAEQALTVMPAEDRWALLTRVLSESDTVSEPRRAARRRPAVWGLAGSVAAAVTFGLLGVAVIETGPQNQATRPAPADSSGTDDDVLLDRIRLAVSEADSMVLRVRTDPGTSVLWDDWFDESSGRARSTSRTPGGDPMYDHEFGRDADGYWVRVVSHQDRAWWEYRSDRFMAQGWSAAEIRRHLNEGTLVEVGREQNDGNSELHLRWAPEQAPDGVRMQPGDLWVDAKTYLPLRSVSDGGAEAPKSGGRRTVTMQFDWLERTPEHLVNLTAPVPSSYRHLPGAPEALGEPGVG